MLLLLASATAFAQHTTTDKVIVTFDNAEDGSAPLVLNGTSEDCYFTVRLVGGGERYYNGFQMDIVLPEGMVVTTTDNELDVVMAKDGFSVDGEDIYPYTSKKGSKSWSHTVDANMIASNILRVMCLSTKSESFTDYSGDLFHVYVKASSYMKPGDVKILIEGVVLNANETDPETGIYHAVSYKPSVECGGTISGVSGDCNMPLKVNGNNKWSTCILPFSTEIPSGVKAYTSASSNEESIFLTEAGSIEAYTPYILYSESGYDGSVSGTVDANNYPESGVVTMGNLTGAIVPQTVTEGFIMQRQDGIVQFYAIADGDSFLVPAGKCWMNVASGKAKAMGFVIVDDEAAVQSIEAQVTGESVCYDLNGRRISTPKSGNIYVKNGKKLLFRQN